MVYGRERGKKTQNHRSLSRLLVFLLFLGGDGDSRVLGWERSWVTVWLWPNGAGSELGDQHLCVPLCLHIPQGFFEFGFFFAGAVSDLGVGISLPCYRLSPWSLQLRSRRFAALSRLEEGGVDVMEGLHPRGGPQIFP